MTSPHDSILRRCAFDESAARREARQHASANLPDPQSGHNDLDVKDAYAAGARWQHAQTEPILRALLAECERLRGALEKIWDTPPADAKGVLAEEALTEHEAEMRRLGGAE